jgi:peroxiredoxin Q/BCP
MHNPFVPQPMKRNPFRLLPLAAAALLAAIALPHPAAASPATGDKAPMVEATDQDGKTWKLSDAIARQTVLLYFYPKDDTKGCTKEACGLRDRMADLRSDNVQVVGVSFDSAESHQKFIAKYSLNFTLLVDTDGKIADAYGARMTGKNMARRVSFLIDRDGTIRHVTDNPSADVQLSDMRAAIDQLPRK